MVKQGWLTNQTCLIKVKQRWKHHKSSQAKAQQRWKTKIIKKHKIKKKPDKQKFTCKKWKH